jgi:cell division protein ZipA
MQANWSIILNVLLLIGVIVAIGRLMQARRHSISSQRYQPSASQSEQNITDTHSYHDDIIAVRKVTREYDDALGQETLQSSVKKSTIKQTMPSLMSEDETSLSPKAEADKLQCESKPSNTSSVKTAISQANHQSERRGGTQSVNASSVMFFLLAKENRQFAGYELLQTVLASGLRFGEGQLFHRHQFANGQGPVLCSLAAATASGVFDLQNIGAFSVRGLCLFMQASNNPTIDAERFSIMVETAKQLSEGLDAHLLDDQRKPLTDERIARYYTMLGIDHIEPDAVVA